MKAVLAPGPSRLPESVPVFRVQQPTVRHVLNTTVIIAALGYFVDIYDLVLFGIVRVPSLVALGVPQAQHLSVGVMLLNAQMVGMLVGGVAWGVMGDKRGRVSVLFGSILLYSLANIANAFVTDITTYAVLRFIAGVGLAGELGAAITLVAEIMPRETRGYGTAVVAAVGILGAVVAALVGGLTDWRTAYVVGGVMGLTLLVARLKLRDSAMFASVKGERRGDLRLLIASPSRAWRLAKCVLIGVPIWFVIGILITFSPELARELRVTGPIVAGTSIAFCYGGAAIGDLVLGFASQRLRSRRKVIFGSMLASAALILVYAASEGVSPAAFYALCFALGAGSGYWAVFATNAAEQFGTNMRATVAIVVPNLVRGSVVLLTLGFTALRPSAGLVASALIVGAVVYALAFLALRGLPETARKSLDFVEA